MPATDLVGNKVVSGGFAYAGRAASTKRWLRDHERVLVPLAALVLFLAFWQLAASEQLINSLFFSSPSQVVAAGYHDVLTAQFWSDLRVSALEFLIGYVLSLTAGLVVGFLLGWFVGLRYVFRPWVDALNSIPGIAFVPLVLIWFGLELNSKIALIFLITFPAVTVNMYTATSSVPRQYLRVARSFGCPQLRLLRSVVFPCIAPFAFAAARIAVGRAVSGFVVGEFFDGNAGLAYRLFQAGQTRDTALVLFGALLITVLALGAFRVVNAVERRVLHWKLVGVGSGLDGK